MQENKLARALGWFSLGIGLAEITAGEALGAALGLEDRTGLLRIYGLREIANGIGILSSKDPAPWIWGRVAGDALNVVTAATGLRDDNPKKNNVAVALALLTGIGAVDLACAQQLTRTSRTGATRRDQGGGTDKETANVERSLTVEKPAEELYQRWRETETLSRVMGHFADIEPVEGGQMRWLVHGPLGRTLEWQMHPVEDRPAEILRWQAAAGAQMPLEASVRFRPAPGGRGTVVTLSLQFDPPGGRLGDAALKLLGRAPGLLASTALRRFKSLVETGEIPTTERQPAGRSDTR